MLETSLHMYVWVLSCIAIYLHTIGFTIQPCLLNWIWTCSFNHEESDLNFNMNFCISTVTYVHTCSCCDLHLHHVLFLHSCFESCHYHLPYTRNIVVSTCMYPSLLTALNCCTWSIHVGCTHFCAPWSDCALTCLALHCTWKLELDSLNHDIKFHLFVLDFIENL